MSKKDELLVFINDKFVLKSEAKISVYDHGLLYGDGVFEGIRVYNGIVFQLKEHIDRLYASANFIRLKIPLSKEELIKRVIETLKVNKLTDAYIRIIVSRGVGDLGLDPRKCISPNIIIITEPVPPYFGRDVKKEGLSCIISSIRRNPTDALPPEIKSLNYLNNILAKIEAIEHGVDEAIFLDVRGFVCEATGENIFIVKDGKIYTPPTHASILQGVTRKRVIRLLKEMNFEVIEKDITLFELINADEVFLTGTMAEIAPVSKINGIIIGDGKVGPITSKLIEEFHKLVTKREEGIPVE
ncbi:Branched-chain-amino-acid aminotransferase [archaeon HR06]|nr:Branched-chain-amino-acid aminotransferase [archaeon HR06]